MKHYKILLIILIMLSLVIVSTALAAQDSQSGIEQTYIVLYGEKKVTNGAARAISKAGGELVYSYEAIGVAIARSADDSFREKALKIKGVQNVGSTAGLAVQLENPTGIDGIEPLIIEQRVNSTLGGEPLGYLQWDMKQIHVPEAHEVTMGDPSVIVGDIDSGIDALHPDLAANVDWSRSVSCIGGVPNTDPAAWEDNNGHGTHTAGTIAAAKNGIGIVGVAPKVKIAAIKGCNDAGYCWPEAIVCSFVWAAEHEIDVTNNSYYVDPYEFNCRNDPEQRVIWKAIQRAVKYAQKEGVVVVSSSGNSNSDLTHHDEEGITNACLDLPVELPGVIGVAANGNLMQKSYYSSYGVGAIEVVAPGGDARFQRTAEAPNGAVLSTIPTKFGSYGWKQGTSMAAPHVTGVAALVASGNRRLPQGAIQAKITRTADSVPCPENPFNPGPPFSYLATCQGGLGYNSFYGHGQVNAFRAVTK